MRGVGSSNLPVPTKFFLSFRRVLRSAQDFASGLPLRLRPLNGSTWGARGRQVKSARPDQILPLIPQGPSLRSGFRQRTPASLTPAKRLNLGCEGSAVQICPSQPIISPSVFQLCRLPHPCDFRRVGITDLDHQIRPCQLDRLEVPTLAKSARVGQPQEESRVLKGWASPPDRAGCPTLRDFRRVGITDLDHQIRPCQLDRLEVPTLAKGARVGQPQEESRGSKMVGQPAGLRSSTTLGTRVQRRRDPEATALRRWGPRQPWARRVHCTGRSGKPSTLRNSKPCNWHKGDRI